MTFLYDLHIHTKEYSPCAKSSAEDLCRKALERGLSGLTLTEHDLWWPDDRLIQLRQKFPGLLIFNGVEYSLPEGHFLTFLPQPDKRTLLNPSSLIGLINSAHYIGGIVIWAHPFRFSRKTPSWIEKIWPDGIEIISTNMDEKAQRQAQQVAMEKQLMAFSNSDAHHTDSVGRFFNSYETKIYNLKDLIQYLRTVNVQVR